MAATVGLPDAQRDPDRLELAKVEQIGNEPRTTDRTVRKLTRVEMLQCSGVLEEHEAIACEWYAERAALAWDTVRVTANYDIGGGGGGATAPDHLAAKTIEIAMARDDYAFAKGFIPPHFLPMFEAIVCRNDSVRDQAEQLYAGLARSQREHKARAALKLCANLLAGGVAKYLPIGQAWA